MYRQSLLVLLAVTSSLGQAVIPGAVEPVSNIISVGDWVTVGDSSQPGWRQNVEGPV